MADSKANLVYPKSNLKEKSSQPGGISPEEAIKKSEHALKQMKNDYQSWLKDDLKEMDGYVVNYAKSELREETLKKITEKIHDIRGHGSTFGFALLSSVAHSLCRLIIETKPGNFPPHELIYLHVNSLHLVAEKKIEGMDSEGAKTLLKSLDAMVNKYLTKPDSLNL